MPSFTDIENTIQNFILKHRLRRAKAILNEKKVEGITKLILDYTTELLKEKQHGTSAKADTDQWNRIENSYMSP